MESKQKGILIVSLVALLLLAVGVTYAYFTASIEGRETESTIITTGGILTIHYSENDNNILVENIYPRDNAWITKTFTITGTNTTDLKMDYRIGIEIEENTFPDNNISYELTNNNPNSGIAVERITYLNGTGTKYFGTGEFVNGSNVEHIYTLKIYLKDNGTNQNGSQEKILKGKLFVVEDGVSGIESPKGWFEAGDNTLLSAIRKRQSSPNRETDPGFTSAGNDPAITDEGLLATEDDYGTSFYYRGSVQDNYVVFANKCWKIVRVDGNGNIKLFLWNNNGPNCSEKKSAGESAFLASNVKYTKDAGGTGEVVETASGVGFMYGKPDATVAFSDNNTGAQDNINDSTILTNLKVWYDAAFDTTNTADYTNVLADAIWCGDKSIDTGDGYGESGHAITFFMTNRRLISNNPRIPSLICPDAVNESGVSDKIKNTSRYTAYSNTDNNATGNGSLAGYKIGLLTADEVAYAGGVAYAAGVYGTANSYYYLYTGSYYWTMSPFIFNGIASNVWRVESTGSLTVVSSNTSWIGLHPSISLIPTVTITSGDGTVNNPYQINVN